MNFLCLFNLTRVSEGLAATSQFLFKRDSTYTQAMRSPELRINKTNKKTSKTAENFINWTNDLD